MPLPALLLPAIAAGAASLFGGILNNRANARQARQQMEFQERMSSTAAQRAVTDYAAAGLNPGLAYGHTESSPSGASAQQSDVVGPAVSNAQSARAAVQALELSARQQINLDLQTRAGVQVAGAQADAAHQQAGLLEQQKMSAARENYVGQLVLPHTMQARVADALKALAQRTDAENVARLSGLRIPGAENEAALQRKLGIWGAGIPFLTSNVGSASQIVRSLTPR